MLTFHAPCNRTHTAASARGAVPLRPTRCLPEPCPLHGRHRNSPFAPSERTRDTVTSRARTVKENPVSLCRLWHAGQTLDSQDRIENASNASLAGSCVQLTKRGVMALSGLAKINCELDPVLQTELGDKLSQQYAGP